MRVLSAAIALALILAAAACSRSKSAPPAAGEAPAAVDSSLTLFFTTELKGSIEPCGCTSDPLGDLARLAELLDEARRGGHPVLYLDGGSALYSNLEIPEDLQAQESLKANLLAESLAKPLATAAVGLGPYDLAEGAERVKPARHAVNLAEGSGISLEAPKVVRAGTTPVGIFGIVSPDAVAHLGLQASDPTAAAKATVAALRAEGATVIVALAHMDRAAATLLAREVEGIDFLLIGEGAPSEPGQVSLEPTRVGDTWLVRPANRGQVVSRFELFIRDESSFQDAGGRARAEAETAELRERIPALEADIKGWREAPDADPGFLKTKEAELRELKSRRERLAREPIQRPAKGNYFTFSQVEIDRALPCSENVVEAKRKLDQAIGEANLAAAANTRPPAAAPGQASYVGAEECALCHREEVDFWKKSRHHGAWETLEGLGKQWSYDCIGCHVTGWQKPGGSNLVHNESLRDVQCESCHGPGSLHVDADGNDQPRTITRSPSESTCTGCHNPDHSDTFEFQAYLRNVTGVGHAPAFRAALGEGPTGHELRAAALKRAGTLIGEGCLK